MISLLVESILCSPCICFYSNNQSFSLCFLEDSVRQESRGDIMTVSLIIISFLLIFTSMTYFLFLKRYGLRNSQVLFYCCDVLEMISLEESSVYFKIVFIEYEECFFSHVHCSFLPFTECARVDMGLWN